MDGQNLVGYEAARTSAAFFLQSETGYLRISGPDQSGFLQRQTTNDIQLLGPGRALFTVLTSPTARILDVFCLLQEGDSISVITLPGRGAQTASFLKSRIFFMDKVTVNDASAEVRQIDLVGPQAAGLLGRLGAGSIPEKSEVVSFQLGDAAIRLLAPERSFGLGYRLLAPVQAAGALEDALRMAGAAQLSPESYQVLRVEAGQPESGFELTEDYTPLETGLETAISDNKGCYTGQEIIARQLTYDKVTQHLCGLRLQGTAEAGERIWVEGKPAGKLTSVVVSPRFGAIALAVLKRPYYKPGTSVQVGPRDDDSQPAVVSSLPFDER